MLEIAKSPRIGGGTNVVRRVPATGPVASCLDLCQPDRKGTTTHSFALHFSYGRLICLFFLFTFFFGWYFCLFLELDIHVLGMKTLI